MGGQSIVMSNKNLFISKSEVKGGKITIAKEDLPGLQKTCKRCGKPIGIGQRGYKYHEYCK